jgi:hypothetical protein
MAGEGFMEGKTVRKVVWPALAVLSVFALAFGAFMASPPAVDAAGLKASLGVGCSVSNGNVKLKFKVSAEAKGGELELVELQVDGSNSFSDTPISVDPSGSKYSNSNVLVDVPNETASYNVVLTVESSNGNTSRTALANVTVNGSSVRCSVRTPAP